MPFTGSHPVAVLPLKRWCSQTPYFAALVIGSMSPDFGYFSPIDVNTIYSHTFEGMIFMDWPISAAILLLVLMARQSFCQLFPNPHRDFLLSLCVKPKFSWKIILITLLCLLFGTLTHVVWDSFTHALSPLVRKSEWLRKEPWFEIPIYRIIQHTSTLLGGLILLLVYCSALRKKGYSPRSQDKTKEIKLYGLWLFIGIFSLALSFVKNKNQFWPLQNFEDYQIFGFRWVVSSLTISFVLLALVWLIQCLLQKIRA